LSPVKLSLLGVLRVFSDTSSLFFAPYVGAFFSFPFFSLYIRFFFYLVKLSLKRRKEGGRRGLPGDNLLFKVSLSCHLGHRLSDIRIVDLGGFGSCFPYLVCLGQVVTKLSLIGWLMALYPVFFLGSCCLFSGWAVFSLFISGISIRRGRVYRLCPISPLLRQSALDIGMFFS